MRALTWNIAFGKPEDTAGLVNVLRSADADVITLNEADHAEVVADIAAQLGMYHVWARGSGDRHVGTLSRYPIVRWQIYNQKPLTQAALATTLNIGRGHLLTVYNIHFRPDPFWHYELFRYLAANALLSLVRQIDSAEPVLIMGDLNTYAAGDPVEVETILRYMREQDRKQLARQRYRFLRLSHRRLLKGGFTDCFRALHPNEPGYTFTRHGHPVTRMDYVLANRPIATRLQCCQTLAGDLEISDHFPLIADFSLK